MSERHFFIIIVLIIVGVVVMFSVDKITESNQDPTIRAREQYPQCVERSQFRDEPTTACDKLLDVSPLNNTQTPTLKVPQQVN